MAESSSAFILNMHYALDTTHPLQRLAERLRLIATHQDNTDLSACLAGKGMPSLSREGDEPAELIWESLSRYLQPDKDMLDLFATTLSQVLHDALQQVVETKFVSGDASAVKYEAFVFNLALLASYLPAHSSLFYALKPFYEREANLAPILGGRAQQTLRNALVWQQTDNSYAQHWFDELLALAQQDETSFEQRSQRVQAMQAWQALLLVPDEIDSIQHTSSLSHRALVAAMGDDFENDPNRQRLVRQMLERISRIHVGGDFVWREYFSVAHGWHTLLLAFAEDIWLNENDPDGLLDTQNDVTWRTGLSLTQRQ
ncbi:MAG: hypothetical protein ORN21_01610, partial [Methylophilaceae bacterium]|nr:hypothetical protein [Methylophilaceae bacterium]